MNHVGQKKNILYIRDTKIMSHHVKCMKNVSDGTKTCQSSFMVHIRAHFKSNCSAFIPVQEINFVSVKVSDKVKKNPTKIANINGHLRLRGLQYFNTINIDQMYLLYWEF